MFYKAVFVGLALAVQAGIGQATTLDLHFNIQPVVICENGRAGTCVTPRLDTALVSAIYEQAGIDVTVLPTWTITSLVMPRTNPAATGETAASVDGSFALASFGNYLLSLGLAANTAYIAATGPKLSLYGMPAQGLAWGNDPSRPFGLYANNGAYSNRLSKSGKASISRLNAQVVAHEVAHMLGARHDTAPKAGTMTHLMETQAYYPKAGKVPIIDTPNIQIMRSSALLTETMIAVTPGPAPVPLPAPILALMAGLATLFSLARRRLPLSRPVLA